MRRGSERKEAGRAFRREKRTHLWFLYLLSAAMALILVYEAATGSLSLQTFAAVLFFLLLLGFVGDWIHKRNVKMLRMVLAVFGVCLLSSAFFSVPVARAYSFSNGIVTASNGAVSVQIPYVTPPNTNFATTTFIGPIPLIDTTGVAAPSILWFEDILINLLLDIANAVIYVANIVIGFVVATMTAIISIPVSIFDAISVTEFGPLVDFFSFIPASYAWIAVGVVWGIAMLEFSVVILALVRLARISIGSVGEITKTEEGELKEETAELA